MLTKKPVKGMKDILPKEMEIRDYCIQVIKETYRQFGFTSIETPSVEAIGNLSSKQGGENEKLLFKILKRGEKLQLGPDVSPQDLVDSGLRYDLTVPLVRFYANNAAQLPAPFKALQMGNVWRAEQPQKGRFRQFMQCDIDIFGEASNLAEIELIQATTTTLGKLGFRAFQIRINDRRLLKEMAAFCSFEETEFDRIFVIIDKADKIGWERVEAELIESGFEPTSVRKYIDLFDQMQASSSNADALLALERILGTERVAGFLPELKEIIDCVTQTKAAEFEIVFDPTLVRGMSYYTGPIFEVSMPQFGGSCGGGGRYDHMVERFIGKDIPACGFSIGFERIVMLLQEQGFQIPNQARKCVYLIEKGIHGEALCEILRTAAKEREQGIAVRVERMNKNRKFQKECLSLEGYQEFKDFYRNEAQ
jgi:histidyl-tRNA synthetase